MPSPYLESVVRATNVPVYSPRPVPAASSPFLNASYELPSPASHPSSSEHHIPASGFDASRRMRVLGLHSQDHQTYAQASSFQIESLQRMGVLHPGEADSSCDLSTSIPSPYSTVHVATKPPPISGSQDHEFSPTSSRAGSKTQLAPQGCSAGNLMDYEVSQTPCQPPSLHRTGFSAHCHAQVNHVPVKPSYEKKRNETSRQARLRYMSEMVGFRLTDPCAPTSSSAPTMPYLPLSSHRSTLSHYEKKRNYFECLGTLIIQQSC